MNALETVFSWVLTTTWQASVLAVLVLAAQWILGARLNPRWRYALWLLVPLRLVLPDVPESALSLFRYAPAAPLNLPETLPAPVISVQVMAIAPTLPHEVVVPQPNYPFLILAILWLCGALGLLLLTFLVNRRFARHVANAPQITEESLRRIFTDAQAELGIRRHVHLVESSQLSSPAIMGLFTPTLLLPNNARAKFTPRELCFIFLHELAHLKRGDVFVQALIALLQVIHWFNPVLWYAFRRLRADREPATDALVLSRTGEADKEPYGLMLLKLLEHFNQRHALPTLVGILEDKDQFKRRFSLIARFTRGAYGWSLLGVALLSLLATVCLTKAKAEAPKKSSSDHVDHVPDLAICFGKRGKTYGFTLGNLAHSGSISDGTTIPSTGETLSVWRKDETATNATLVFIATKPSGPAEKRPDGSTIQPIAERREEHVVPLAEPSSFRIFDSVDVTTAPTLDQLDAAAKRTHEAGASTTPTANAPAQKAAPVRLQFLAIDTPEGVFTGANAAESALKTYEQAEEKQEKGDLETYGRGGKNAPRLIGHIALHTRMGQGAGWISGPSRPCITAEGTPQPHGSQISITGTLTLNSQQWSGVDPHRNDTITPIPNASYPINLDVDPQQLRATQPEGILEPDAALPAHDKTPRRLFVYLSAWPESEADAAAAVDVVTASADPPASPSNAATASDPALDQKLVGLVQNASTDKVGAGDADKVAQLLAQGADPNAKTGGMPVLIWALNFGKDDAAVALIQKGADINATDGRMSAVELAAMIYYCPNALDALLKKGAHLPQGRSVLDAVFSAGPAAAGKMNYLHDRAWTDKDHLAWVQRQRRVIELLAATGIDLNGTPGGTPPLIRAIRGGHLEAARELLKLGAKPDVHDANGETPQSAAQLWHPEFLPELEAAAKRAHEAAARPSPESSDDAALAAKLDAVHVDLPAFSNAALNDVVVQLSQAIVRGDPAHEGFNFVVPQTTEAQAIRLDLTAMRNVPAMDALAAIAKAAQLTYKMDARAIYLQPRADEADLMTVRTFLVPSGFLKAVNQDQTNVESQLLAHGIPFAGGSSAIFLPAMNKHVVRDTPDALDTLQTMLQAAAAASPQATPASSAHADAVAPAAADAAKPQGDFVRIDAKVLQISEDDYQAHRVDIDAAMKAGNLQPVASLKSFDLISEPAVLMKSGERGVIEAVRVFPFPTQFKRDATGSLTATEFARRDIGVRFPVTATINAQKINISGELSLSTFRGWTQTGLNTFSPGIDTQDVYFNDELSSGETRGIATAGTEITDTNGTPATPGFVSKPPKLVRLFLFLTATALMKDQVYAATANAPASFGPTPAPASAAAAKFPEVTVSGRVRLSPAGQVDLAKSSGYMQGSDGGSIEFHFQPDGSFAIPQVKPGVYNRHMHFVPANPALAAEAVDMNLEPLTVAGTLPRLTLNLSFSMEFGPVTKNSIKIGLNLIEISDAAYLVNKAKVDTAIEKGDVGFFRNMEGVSLLSTPSVSTTPGTKANIDILREFPYPTEFESGKVVPHQTLSVPGGSMTNVTLMVPPTPREFVTKDVGVTAEITPTINDANTDAPGKIVLCGKVSVTDFEGFTKSNVDGVASMPSFTTSETNFLEQVSERELKGMWLPGLHARESLPDTYRAIDASPDTTAKRLLFFLSATRVP